MGEISTEKIYEVDEGDDELRIEHKKPIENSFLHRILPLLVHKFLRALICWVFLLSLSPNLWFVGKKKWNRIWKMAASLCSPYICLVILMGLICCCTRHLALYYVVEYVNVTMNFNSCLRLHFEDFLCLPLFSETWWGRMSFLGLLLLSLFAFF